MMKIYKNEDEMEKYTQHIRSEWKKSLPPSKNRCTTFVISDVNGPCEPGTYPRTGTH